MSDKQALPTLAGVNVKTRKRNIVVPSDPGSFADAIVQIFADSAADGGTVEQQLEAGANQLGSVELDFSRYAETLFEVFVAGGRLTTGGNLAEDGAKLAVNVLACDATPEAIQPFIKLFQLLIRRRPFLIKGLEAVLNKFILSLEFYDEAGKRKIAITAALCLTNKLALPENVLPTLLNDRLVQKGSVLDFCTTAFKVIIDREGLDDLVAMLAKGRLAGRVMDLMPPGKRSEEAFAAHFKAAGMDSLVAWNAQRQVTAKLEELQEHVAGLMGADPATPAAEVIAAVKARKDDSGLPDADLVPMLWACMVKSIDMKGKNQSQITQALMQRLKQYHKLLAAHVTNARLELALLVAVQVTCYEDNRLLKLFSDIVRMLYNTELLGEDTIQHWYKKGSHPKGRNVFLRDIEPFLKWLEEAEEEEDEDEEE